jgi:hypothetical protein
MTGRHHLVADRSGAAAAEMALVTPLLILLMAATFELGHYFLSEHVVQKSVRDAARYAARLPITAYPGCVLSPAAESQIRKLARTGSPDGTVQRLQGWTNDNMVTVQLSCNGGLTTGIYKDFPGGAPIIMVKASVDYPPLMGTMGIKLPVLKLNAASHTAGYGA